MVGQYLSVMYREGMQHTGPVKVLLAFVAHVPTRLLSTNWAEATLPKASVAVRANAEGSLMSVALCVRVVLSSLVGVY